MVESSLGGALCGTAKFRTPTTIIIFKMVTKPNMVEFVFLAQSWHKWHSHGWRLLEPVWPKREVQHCQSQPVSSDSMFGLVPVFLQMISCVQLLQQNFFVVVVFFLAVSRPDSGNCHERDAECGHHTYLYERTRTFFSCAPHT